MKCLKQVKPQKQRADWWLPGAQKEEMKSNCLMDTGLYFGVMKMFGNYIEVMGVLGFEK